ncbi:WD40 repeat domain-containing serine/threonine protein kinase [Streptomyces sp. NRRL S-87]|uniref:WD40 repeat domain-containing serine/threonine protein kinase n=1 Tax=Streptomyces sp. NRRL S-87 TaxID=1463920 RepID=UPI00068DD0D3|nr:WD40 repeat domain-containing serine/threonine protein kinase [Streptomyces sp. NRRL S-87]
MSTSTRSTENNAPGAAGAGAGTPLAPEDPQRIGPYWLASRLGAGGQGVVYEAYDADGARVALKALHRDADPFVRDRFGKEAEAARRVAAFCTARVLDAAVDGDTPYLVSEYVPGPTLAAEVRANGPLTEDATLRLATGAATALAAIHAAGVVHRDLKPGNVLLGPDGPRIIDFGIARAPDMSLTATGAIMGTLGYMAPEALAGQRASTASDVFAWGAVVLYAATGTEPFRGENIAEVAHRTASVTPDLSGLPPRLRPLIAAALSKDPAGRPTAQALLTGLISATAPYDDPAGATAPDTRTSRDSRPTGTSPQGAHLADAPTQGTHPAGDAHPATTVDPHPATTRDAGPAGPIDPRVPAPTPTPTPAAAAGAAAAAAARSGTTPKEGLDLLRAGAEQAGGTPYPATQAVPPLGDRAEAAYAALGPDAQLAAQDLLLRLTLPGGAPDGSQDTVRTATPAELFAGRTESEQRATARAAEALTAAGALVTEADGAVRPVSTALLPAWRRLRAWADADRAGIAYRQRVTHGTHRWTAHGQRTDDLLTGSDLRAVLDWLPTAPPYLRPNPAEQDFLTASRTEAARTVRRRRQLLAGLAGATVVALLAGGVAYLQNREAQLRQDQATARAVAQAADSLRGTQPDTAMLLGVAAYRIAHVPEARAALNASAAQREIGSLPLPAVSKGVGDDSGRVYSPDGRLVLAFGPSGARLYDLGSSRSELGRPLASIPAAQYVIEKASLVSPDAAHALARAKDGTYHLLSVRDGKPVGGPFAVPEGYEPYRLTTSGRVVLMNKHNAEEQLTDATGRFLSAVPPGIIASPDGRYLGSCPDGGSLSVDAVGPSGPSRVLSGQDGDCEDIAFSPDGRYLVEDTSGSRTRVWDLNTGRTTATLSTTGSDLQFSSGGNYLVGPGSESRGNSGALEIWNARADAAQPLVRIPVEARHNVLHGRDVFEVRLDEGAKLLRYEATGSNELKVTDVAPVLDAGTDAAGTQGAALSPDGGTAVVRTGGRVDPTLRLLDVRTGKAIGTTVRQRFPADIDARPMAAVSDGGRVVAHNDLVRGGFWGVIVRDARTGAVLSKLPWQAGGPMLHLGLSSDGAYATTTYTDGTSPSADGTVTQVWDTRTGKKVHEFKATAGHGVFSPDGRRFLTTAGDEFDLATRTARTVPLGTSRNAEISFSHDGRWAAVLRDSGWVEVWDGALRKRKALLPSSLVRGGDRYGDSTASLTFSADGSQLALVVNGDSVQLWDVDARLALGKPLSITGRQIDAMAFDGDTLRALSGSHVSPFDLDPDRLVTQVCERVGRQLSKEEWETYIPDADYRKVC